MSTELERTASGTPAVEPFPRFLIQRGADLVHLVEDLYHRLFLLSIALVGYGSVLSVWLQPSAGAHNHSTLSLSFAALGLAGCIAGLRAPAALYRWLRYDHLHQVAPAILAAILVFVNGPYSPSWWIALPLLFVLSAVSSLRTTFASAVGCSLAFLCGSLLRGAPIIPHGDIGNLAAAVGLVANPIVGRAVAEAFARFILRLHQVERDLASPRPPPIKVDTNITPGPRTTDVLRKAILRRPQRSQASRLTARQLQVAFLLRDGLRQAEIALCLAISPRQVERLVAEARERTGARTTSQLLAMLVEQHLVPNPPATKHHPAQREQPRSA